ncbi:MAG TPA: MFS transporter [Terriglobales bacterium]|nr:MFS transporter [Terriglobales bacterium]
MAASANSEFSGRVAFSYPNFTAYVGARFFVVVALEMQSVAVGWQVYEITRRPLDLGLVGLAQFVPGILFFLPAGHAADRFDRRRLLLLCYAGYAVCSSLLLLIALAATHSVVLIYLVVALLGLLRAFSFPASRALLPQLVAQTHFSNAVAWHSTAFQAATILGPTVGGMVYALFHGAAPVYASASLVSLAALASMLRIRVREKPRPQEPLNFATLLVGFRYIWEHKLVLGCLTLDLFAVLLGGAVALLPVYAHEILHTGPWGLGLLRSAPGVGAGSMAILIAHRPLKSRAGPTMLWCVAGFGVFTIIFGISRNLTLSLVSLLLVGASDMVSVVIRAILIQLGTPDRMRGRINAVDMLFIGASNQLGEFESGLTAHWFGTVPAVVLGGVGTLVVVAIWAWMFPALRQPNLAGTVELEPAES